MLKDQKCQKTTLEVFIFCQREVDCADPLCGCLSHKTIKNGNIPITVRQYQVVLHNELKHRLLVKIKHNSYYTVKGLNWASSSSLS